MRVYVYIRARENGDESHYILTCVCICVHVCTHVVVSVYVHSMDPCKYLGLRACLRATTTMAVSNRRGPPGGGHHNRTNADQDLQKSGLSSTSVPSTQVP